MTTRNSSSTAIAEEDLPDAKDLYASVSDSENESKTGDPVSIYFFRSSGSQLRESPHPLSGDSSHAIYDLEGRRYPTLVHYFFAQRFPENSEWVANICSMESGRVAAIMGRADTEDGQTGWKGGSSAIVLRGIFLKAALHLDVYNTLTHEYKATVEIGEDIQAEDDDDYWGTGKNGAGRNIYGRMLEIAGIACINGDIPVPNEFVDKNKSLLSKAIAAWELYQEQVFE